MMNDKVNLKITKGEEGILYFLVSEYIDSKEFYKAEPVVKEQTINLKNILCQTKKLNLTI